MTNGLVVQDDGCSAGKNSGQLYRYFCAQQTPKSLLEDTETTDNCTGLNTYDSCVVTILTCGWQPMILVRYLVLLSWQLIWWLL